MEKEKRVLKCVNNEGLETRLTIGRYYSVEHTYVSANDKVESYRILDDTGTYQIFLSERFVASTPRSISTKDPIVEQVKEMFDKRSEVGIKKYGTTLHENNTDDFLLHLQEELLDAILYLEKLKEKQLAFKLNIIAAFQAGYMDGYSDHNKDGKKYENGTDYFEQVIKGKI